MSDLISIVIVDDHPVVRQGISSLLSSYDQFQIVGEADNAADGLKLILSLGPEVTLLDIRMPGRSGLDLLRDIKAADLETKVLILTSFEDEVYIKDALTAGAVGYILKNASDNSLVQAIEAASRGERVLSPKITEKVVAQLIAENRPEGEITAATAPLEEEEILILKLLASGSANSEVADHLFISATTLKRKMRRILEKMGVQTRVQAVAEAVRRDLI